MVETIITYRNPYAGLTTEQITYLGLTRAIQGLIRANRRANYVLHIGPTVEKLMDVREAHFQRCYKEGRKVFTPAAYGD